MPGLRMCLGHFPFGSRLGRGNRVLASSRNDSGGASSVDSGCNDELSSSAQRIFWHSRTTHLLHRGQSDSAYCGNPPIWIVRHLDLREWRVLLFIFSVLRIDPLSRFSSCFLRSNSILPVAR